MAARLDRDHGKALGATMGRRPKTLRGRISDTRRAWSSTTTTGAHRRAVLMLLAERSHRAGASQVELDRYCFRPLTGVPWCHDKTNDLLKEMEREGELIVDWQQTLNGSEEPSWIWPSHPGARRSTTKDAATPERG